MNTPAPRSFGIRATLAVFLIGCLAFGIGFAVLPNAEPHLGLWQRICRAAGIVPSRAAAAIVVAPAGYTSVVIPHAALREGTAEEKGRGATLALRCTACHGAQGVSGANAPNLAGQYPEVLYKQLVDFVRGARIDAVMGAMAANLSDADLLDISHYYASLPAAAKERPLAGAPALVRVGDPMRNIAPCASCHASTDGKYGAPALDGEPPAYLSAQLAAFARGTRHNDANAAMRNEARRLTAAEIDAVIAHYAGAAH